MIDTIILRINNLNQYPKIYEQYYAPQEKKDTISQAYVDENTGEILENTFFKRTIFHDSNRVLPLTYRSYNFIRSSHYSLSYKLDTEKNYLEFNFSVPKYVYSTNVIQFVNISDQSVHVMYLELMQFIHKFIKENFIHSPLLSDVEINRIDLCYNQFFNTKEDALQYLDEQKILNQKFARSSANNHTTYETSFMYKTRRYSFKVYHKGTEFKKNDLQELMKKNPLKLPLTYILDQAETILRYEMTFRKSMLSYLAKHYFNVSKTHAENNIYKDHKYTKYCRHLAVIAPAKQYQEYVDSQKNFTLESEFDHNAPVDVLFHARNITFDETMFSIVFKTFWDKVQAYQLQNTVSPAEIVNKINSYNESLRMKNKYRRVPKKSLTTYRMLSAAMLILKGVNLDDFKKYVPASTLRDLKADLKKIGITAKHSNLLLPVPRTDYLDYKIFFKQFH